MRRRKSMRTIIIVLVGALLRRIKILVGTRWEVVSMLLLDNWTFGNTEGSIRSNHYHASMLSPPPAQ